MNTVINQLVKEAAYHAAKYDSTIAAINALSQSENLTKTAGLEGLGAAMGAVGGLGTQLKNELYNGASDLINVLPQAAEEAGSKIPAALRAMNGAGAESTLGNLAEIMGSPQGIAAGLGAGAGAAGLGALWNKLKGGQAAAPGMMDSIKGGLGSVGQAIKNHPYIAGGLGLAGAGAAALPFLMGGDGAEKQSSYDPSKLAALRNVLANMQ